MKRQDDSGLRYIITTHRHLEGVGLSRSGSWTGMRYPDDDSAARAARADANGKPMTIERERA